MLKTLKKRLGKGDDGFTLIELLVVVVIIGILIGIAIPVYLNYRKSANDKSAQSDIRNAVSTFEVCNSDNGVYPSAVDSAGAMTGCDNQSIKLTTNTTLRYAFVSPNYTIFGQNSGGTTVYCYSSANGGGVKKASSNTLSSATCP